MTAVTWFGYVNYSTLNTVLLEDRKQRVLTIHIEAIEVEKIRATNLLHFYCRLCVDLSRQLYIVDLFMEFFSDTFNKVSPEPNCVLFIQVYPAYRSLQPAVAKIIKRI
jgi:hypothetical protein